MVRDYKAHNFKRDDRDRTGRDLRICNFHDEEDSFGGG